jgi:hypothetical protein
MFNWICPRCGREVPPSEAECRVCAAARADAPASPETAVIPPLEVAAHADIPSAEKLLPVLIQIETDLHSKLLPVLIQIDANIRSIRTAANLFVWLTIIGLFFGLLYAFLSAIH